ncbi:hypothetical protein NLG97_g6857 [Lecanicillium saksenae]|uniref:Uncharacterized protein n=1 Tax=Lecanicillium saksenae TaxID=468837 RepID=A0ACC1QRN5_9HYPO|nr:hypothetical protein NLG97_g6857 [Lecanicillium saksenae]
MPGSSHNLPGRPLELHIRRDSRPTESDDIERLLSSSFYPGASSSYNHTGPSPAYSAVFLDDDNGYSPEQQTTDSQSPDNTRATRNKRRAPPAQSKTAGTKRKSDAGENEGPGERRRKQIREAQRAYRQRKISQTAYLEERVKQLEGAIENMSSVVLSFSEELIGSNILCCQSDLTNRLRDALATCLSLVRETGSGALREDSSDEAEPNNPAGHGSMALVPSIPPMMPAKPIRHQEHLGNKPTRT